MATIETDWLTDLVRRQSGLKKDLDRLHRGSEPDVDDRRRRTYLNRRIRSQIEEIQSLLDDCLCGRSEHERDVMLYRARLSLALFNHLRQVYSPPPAGHRS